ncbi:MAG TPA: hypothetical protein VMB49_22600, partial [Acidobacteriaceae bacterium]|nr:hypothetical protein [Acidobacteriaceae bacterium]
MADLGSLVQRREFLKLGGAVTALSLTHRAFAGARERVSIIVDPEQNCAFSDSVYWAAGQLR